MKCQSVEHQSRWAFRFLCLDSVRLLETLLCLAKRQGWKKGDHYDSLMASALGYLWCGVATTIMSLLTARLVSGICGGTLPVVQAMILDVVGDPRERPKYWPCLYAWVGIHDWSCIGSCCSVHLRKQTCLSSLQL